MGFKVLVDERALHDVQEAIDYYEEQKAGLGKTFESVLNRHLSALEKNPFYSIRYDNVRCLPLKKFPFMVHFTIDEEENKVLIHAVFHTARDPGKWIR